MTVAESPIKPGDKFLHGLFEMTIRRLDVPEVEGYDGGLPGVWVSEKYPVGRYGCKTQRWFMPFGSVSSFAEHLSARGYERI